MKTKINIFKYAATIFFIIVAAVFLLLSLEYRPDQIEKVTAYNIPEQELLLHKDTLTILSWNIGYAGYEQSMDFFYDGGSRVRTTKENTNNNLQGIISIIKSVRDVDFILLQEVDKSSKRSYYINILDSICNIFPDYYCYYATNFRCNFVPIPISDPIGKVESGLVLLSRYKPSDVKRHQLPGSFSFPTRVFNLKRCLLEASFGDSIWITNVHNSAFDDGSMRKKEIGYIDSITSQRIYSFTAGDWNSTPPGYDPSDEEISNHFFSPLKLGPQDIKNVNFLVDYSNHTMRYLYEPYRKGHTTESLIDFAVITKGFKVIRVKTLADHKFRFSDHNPILYKVAIIHQGVESH